MEYHSIPITTDSYIAGNSAYLYCLAAAEATTDQVTMFKPHMSTVTFRYDAAVFRQQGVKYGVNKRTLSTFEDNYPSPLALTSNFIVMMSPKAWLFLNEWFIKDNLPTRTRTTYTRVYLYFYYWIIALHCQFIRPFLFIKSDLAINKNVLSEAINWLCGHKLLFHSTYTFNNEENRARTYYIPTGLWPENVSERLIERRRVE